MQASEPASLTLANVEIALQCLTSGSPYVKEAEGALLTWQDQQCNAYIYTLLCATLNPQVRLAALLALKAAILKAWKDRGRSQRQFLDEPTKQQVRYVLLSLVTTGDNPLLQQQAAQHPYDVASVIHDRTVQVRRDASGNTIDPGTSLTIAVHITLVLQSAAASSLVQVARLDLPKQFHELVPSLVSHVMSVDHSNMQRRNAAYVLEAILEEQSQKRLLGDKNYMREIAMNHAASLVQEALRLVTMLSSDATVDAAVSETILLLIRVLHYWLQSALPFLVESTNDAHAAVDQWMKLTLDCSSALLSELSSSSNSHVAKILPGLCVELWELVVDVQQAHPIAFGRFLEPFLIMFYNALFLGKDGTVSFVEPQAYLRYYEERIMQTSKLPEALTILALRFLANIVSCSFYIPDETENEAVAVIRTDSNGPRTAITSKGDTLLQPSDVQYAVQIVWTRFFTRECICNLADLSICSLMTMSKERMDDWATNPEDFFLSDEHRTAEDDVSAAAQNLYCGLVESSAGSQVFLPRLVSLLNDSESQARASKAEAGISPYAVTVASFPVHPSAVLWESVYTAAGLSVNVLDDFAAWNYAAWYERILSPCLALILSSQSDVSTDVLSLAVGDEILVRPTHFLIAPLFSVAVAIYTAASTSHHLAHWLQ